jgi:MoxR-like ATPase
MIATQKADVVLLADRYRALGRAIGEVVIGQEEAVRLCFLTLVSSGHSLLEGVPGVGKTLLVRTLAAALDVRFGRVQFTPDLMPSDVIGTSLLDAQGRAAEFHPGPLFTDLLLADEINRASAKTQAALLEAMQERAATVAGRRHALGAHFAVFATQNPVEQEGTYPLPEAELDRFLFKIVMGYPDQEDELALLARHHGGAGEAKVGPVLGGGEIEALRGVVDAVIVRDSVRAYVAALVRATRADAQFGLGASPRAGVMLLRAAKAHAALEGRDYVIPEDVQTLFLPTLRHRVQLDPAVEVEGIGVDTALDHVLRGVTVPR